MSGNKMLEVRGRMGPSLFTVDISDEAVGRFGNFRHGDAICDEDGDEGVILGVAPFPVPCPNASDCKEKNCPAKTGKDTLWYSLVEYGDNVFPLVSETQLVRRKVRS